MILAHRPAAPRSARRAEGGSVVLLVAISLSVLVTATAFTVDLGQVSTRRRDLQVVADVAALDLARQLDGRTTAELLADPAWAQGLAASLARNGRSPSEGDAATTALGTWDPRTEVFEPTAGDEVPTAVRVEVSSYVDFAFAPGGRASTRTAVAANGAVAGHAVGSFAARLGSASSPLLAGLLGDALGVTAVGYDGLADGRVGLEALATELDLDLGDVDGLLGTELTVVEVVRAEAEVLRRAGELARAQLLDAIAADLDHPGAPIALGQLLSIASGGERAAASASLDALELLAAVAFVANGDAFLAVPSLTVDVAGQAVAVDARAQVIERPRWAFGPVGATASTAQVRVLAEGALTVPGVSATSFTVDLAAASGTATSAAVACGQPQRLDLDVAGGLVTTRIDLASRLSVGPLPVADVDLHAAVAPPSSVVATDFVLPPDPYGQPRQAPLPSVELGAAEVVVDRTDVLGLPLGVAVGPLVDALVAAVARPLVDVLEASLLRPLADVVGVSLGGVDVVPLAVDCAGPRLVG